MTGFEFGFRSTVFCAHSLPRYAGQFRKGTSDEHSGKPHDNREYLRLRPIANEGESNQHPFD